MEKKGHTVPTQALTALKTLHSAGFEAYLVGGCVRDLLLNRKPKDWDITTNANPEQIINLFEKTYYENSFGTVSVIYEDAADETLKEIQITPYRTESSYSDKRHPDTVSFNATLIEDLSRRDFTGNAIAYNPENGDFVDPYGGQGDIKKSLIKAVGDPKERFAEDPLRILRAIRLAVELDFSIESTTAEAIHTSAALLQKVSGERIRDEFIRIIESQNPMIGIILSHSLGILQGIIPEIEEGIGIEQNGDHIYPVFEHILRALQHAADKKWPLHIRLAALFHDIGKPRTRRWSEEKKDWTFYGHEVVGAKMTQKIMERLRFPKKITNDVVTLVRYHMFFSDTDKISLSAVRRIVRNVGEELIWDLMNVRSCDRIGMNRPKETPYRLRKYHSMIDEALRAPTSVGMLKIDGASLMDVTRETPGPRLGFILHALLEEVLEDPSLNEEEYLKKRALELTQLSTKELAELGQKGKEKKEEVEEQELAKIHSKHGVLNAKGKKSLLK